MSEADAEREMVEVGEEHESHTRFPGDTLCQECARGHGIRWVAHGRRVASYLQPLAGPKPIVAPDVRGLRVLAKAHFDHPKSVSPEWL